jgi:hypothetical protein
MTSAPQAQNSTLVVHHKHKTTHDKCTTSTKQHMTSAPQAQNSTLAVHHKHKTAHDKCTTSTKQHIGSAPQAHRLTNSCTKYKVVSLIIVLYINAAKMGRTSR